MENPSSITNTERDSVDTSSECENTFRKITKFSLSEDLRQKLQKELPDVFELILTLQKCIEKQKRKVKSLKRKLKSFKPTKHISTQTCEAEEIDDEPKSIADDIKEAAEQAVQNTGFVYEETSGLYYDYNTGYYYNAELGLYYDGNTGTYMKYNTETESYEFHSQVTVPTSSTSETQNASHPASDIKRSTAKHSRKKKAPESIQACKRRRPLSDDEATLDLEEGECSDSSHSANILSSDEENVLDVNDISKPWPPCMRIIVEETSLLKLKVGTLSVITYEGGTLGREGDHSIIIPDINISKHHLKITFDKESSQYRVTDLGSRNGTLLNGKRISASKQESEPQEVAHGSHIQIGSTILLCHIHAGNETCGHCEPGLLQTTNDIKPAASQSNKIDQHKMELRKLRKKFGMDGHGEKGTELAAGYTDRAQIRRETIGSQNPHEKTQVASVNESIASDNKGFKLLAKMGWTEGQSLGKKGEGVLEPIEVVSSQDKRGVGFNDIKLPVIPDNKQQLWKKTQQRYQQISQSQKLSLDDSD